MVLVDASTTSWPTSAMTGASSPAPFVASESSNDGSREGWRAFDGTPGDANRWITASGAGPHWLKIDLGSTQDIRALRIAPDGVGGSGYFIVDFTLEGSATGSFAGEETTVITSVGLTQTDWGALTYTDFSTLSVSGVVTDDAGTGAARTLRFYRRDTGAFLGTVTSSSSDGTYTFPTAYTGEVQVICLDDSGGTTYNDLISRATAA